MCVCIRGLQLSNWPLRDEIIDAKINHVFLGSFLKPLQTLRCLISNHEARTKLWRVYYMGFICVHVKNDFSSAQ